MFGSCATIRPGRASCGRRELTGDRPPVEILSGAGHRSGLPLADGSIVNLADRGDFGGRPGEEYLVGVVEVAALERRLAYFVTLVGEQSHDTATGDPVEHPRAHAGGEHHTVAHRK